MDRMPAWADAVLVPLISLLLAALLSALVILGIGENPIEALKLMVEGALLRSAGWGYTLYYATNFIFTGLAVSVAFHAKLFNIGGEGQAMIGGLGVALVCLYLPWPHWSLRSRRGIGRGGALRRGLGVHSRVPAGQARQSHRDHHDHVQLHRRGASELPARQRDEARGAAGSGNRASSPPRRTCRPFRTCSRPRRCRSSADRPANVTFFLAIAACLVVWALIWRTRLGYEIRALGHSESAARYAGISPVRTIVIAMLISGALAGLMGVNTAMGEAERLVMNATEGAGFIGIAVALMGRNHPIGVFLAAILFGFLYQGGAELALWTNIPRELIVVIQALVILFTGALDNMVRMPLERMFVARRRARKTPAE